MNFGCGVGVLGNLEFGSYLGSWGPPFSSPTLPQLQMSWLAAGSPPQTDWCDDDITGAASQRGSMLEQLEQSICKIVPVITIHYERPFQFNLVKR